MISTARKKGGRAATPEPNWMRRRARISCAMRPFARACRTGDLVRAIEAFRVQPPHPTELRREFLAAVRRNHPQVVRWLGEHLSPIPPQLAAAALRISCGTGSAETTQWLADKLAGDTPARTAIRLLRCACANGRFGAAQSLERNLAIAQTIRDHPSPAKSRWRRKILSSACCSGNLELIQWVVAQYEITKAEARPPHDDALLGTACLNGDQAVVEWVVDHFDLTAEDIRKGHNEALQSACEGRYAHTIEWLIRRFALTADDLRTSTGGDILAEACARGDLEIAQTLAERLGLTTEQIRLRVGEACRASPDIAQWLADPTSSACNSARSPAPDPI
jgi:hypothetical protein